MKHLGTCVAVVVALVLTGAMAWGQDSATEKPKAQGVEVKVTQIQETRSRDFSQDTMVQISRTRVGLALTGGQPAKANKYGKLKIEKAVDDKGTDLSLPLEDDLSDRDVIEGFIATEKSFGPKIEDGFAFDIHLGLTKREASKIAQLKGSVSIVSGGKKASVTISDLASLAGKEAPNPELKAAQVTLKIESVKDNTITYTMTGAADAVQEIELTDADGKTVETCKGSFSENDGPKSYTLRPLQAGAMPAKPALKVTLVTGSTITTVPFDLKDIPLP